MCFSCCSTPRSLPPQPSGGLNPLDHTTSTIAASTSTSGSQSAVVITHISTIPELMKIAKSRFMMAITTHAINEWRMERSYNLSTRPKIPETTPIAEEEIDILEEEDKTQAVTPTQKITSWLAAVETPPINDLK